MLIFKNVTYFLLISNFNVQQRKTVNNKQHFQDSVKNLREV